MELPIICPLCSQLGFPDVNSLWLNLIRAATRHLACPVCQEILCGLDKLTIHLVSHLLQDQVPQTYFTSNISSSYVGCSRNPESQILNEPVLAASLQHHDVVKDSTPMASYVVINFPSLQNLAVDNSGQLKLAEYSSVIEGEKSTSAAPSSVANFSTSPNANLSECGTTTVATQNQVTGSKFMCASNTMHTDEPVITSSHPRVKLEEGSNLNDGLIVPTENDGSRQRNIEETEYIGTVPSNLLCESESKPKSSFDNFVPDTSGPVVKCGVCHLVFKDNSILLLHQQLVHNSKTCNDSQHQMSPKNDERGLTPRPSPSKSKRGSIASQNRDAAASLHRFPCHVCNKVFRMRGSLMVHLRVAHSPSGAIGLSARLDSTVSSVMSQQGDDVSCKLLQNLSIKEADLVTGKNLNSTGFNVGQINEQFEFSGGACSTLNPQVSSVHDQSSSVSKRTSMETVNSCSPLISSVASIESPANTPIESLGIVFPCTLCNKSFSKEVLLAQHCKSHDSKQWKCDVCFKLFTTKYFLKKHKRLHTGEMPYTCVICNKSFTFQQSYHKHLLYHSDEKPHSCADCGRAFKELSTLHNHQRIHTGEKPWACETCDVAAVCA